MRLCRETVIQPCAIAGHMDCMIERKTLKSKDSAVKLKNQAGFSARDMFGVHRCARSVQRRIRAKYSG